jgi:hypothetical protein
VGFSVLAPAHKRARGLERSALGGCLGDVSDGDELVGWLRGVGRPATKPIWWAHVSESHHEHNHPSGHEYVGIVEEVGNYVRSVRPGQFV